MSLGGPNSLQALLDDPRIVPRILREWPRDRNTLQVMLSAFLRLIDFTVGDDRRANALKDEILAGLYPRPLQKRSWHILPRTVGGVTRARGQRPVLSQADIKKIVASAPAASPDHEAARRDAALAALACWSGVKPFELETLRWEQLQWAEPSEDAPWCAMIHGIVRRRRRVSIPVADDAAPHLRALFEAASDGESPPSGPIFRSIEPRVRPLKYSTIRRIIRLAVQNAGLPNCDHTTFRRTYAAYLLTRGVSDYGIRDALGLTSMASVEDLLRRHRWAAAQRLAAEHHVIEPPGLPLAGTGWRQLTLDAALADEQ
jgi:integrase